MIEPEPVTVRHGIPGTLCHSGGMRSNLSSCVFANRES